MIKILLERTKGDFGFVAKDPNEHSIILDASVEHGGMNAGVRPMQTLLMALGACSGIDIVSILKKQRQTIEYFAIHVEGEREQHKEPSLWKTVNIIFELRGKIDFNKAKKACGLSIEKYCSVAETLRRAGAQISWSINLNTNQ